jgi:serine/threonine protein kinase
METLNAKLSGSKINQYQIVKQIGQGSYATVHLATDTLLNTNVAIKQFSKGKLRRQRAIFRKGNSIDLIRSEVAILKKLDHCNIVKLFEVLDDPTQDSLFMVFELCDKSVMSIDANSSTTPLEISLARNYFTQLVYGLEYSTHI